MAQPGRSAHQGGRLDRGTRETPTKPTKGSPPFAPFAPVRGFRDPNSPACPPAAGPASAACAPHGGNRAYVLSNHVYGYLRSDEIPVSPGSAYDLYAYVRGELDPDDSHGKWLVRANFYRSDGGSLDYLNVASGAAGTLDTTWQNRGGRVTAPANAATMRIELYNYMNSGWVAYDDVTLPVQVRATSYYYFNGKRIAMRKDGNLTFLHGDHLGSTSLATTASGGDAVRQWYYPYGGQRHADGTLPTDYRFTGQRSESTIGLYDYGARFYDPLLGRFVSADTVVPGAGNPQALNRYSYVLNNPLRYTDPTGHIIFEEDPDDSVIVWTQPNGGAVRSAAGVTLQSAPMDARLGYDIRGYLEGQGIRFTGAAWTTEDYRKVGAAYQKVRTAFVNNGYDPSAALGLGHGLTFNKITTGNSTANGPANTINFNCTEDPFWLEVETAVHEMGHIFDWRARDSDSSLDHSASRSWREPAGWQQHSSPGFWFLTSEGYDGIPTLNAQWDPREDVADTFTWWVYSQSEDSFSRALEGGPSPGRQHALSVALEKFR